MAVFKEIRKIGSPIEFYYHIVVKNLTNENPDNMQNSRSQTRSKKYIYTEFNVPDERKKEEMLK